MNPHFNNFVAKQLDKPYPLHKYLPQTENPKINTDIIHLLSTVRQAPMQKIHKAAGDLLGNSNRVEEVTEHGLLKKMAQSSALFCKEPTSILTPHLLLTLCFTMRLLAFGQAVWYTWLVQASVCFNTLTLCWAIVVQSLSIKRPQPCQVVMTFPDWDIFILQHNMHLTFANVKFWIEKRAGK